MSFAADAIGRPPAYGRNGSKANAAPTAGMGGKLTLAIKRANAGFTVISF